MSSMHMMDFDMGDMLPTEDYSMHGPEVFSLELTVDRPHFKEAVRAILHTILFHRIFSLVTPLELDTLDLTYPSVEDSDVGKKIEDKIRLLTTKADVMAPQAFTEIQQRSRGPSHVRIPSSSSAVSLSAQPSSSSITSSSSSSSSSSHQSPGASPSAPSTLSSTPPGVILTSTPKSSSPHPSAHRRSSSSIKHLPTRVQLAVFFFEKKHRSAWFGKSDTDVCWEQWLLTITVSWPVTEKDRSKDRAISAASLRQALGEVLRLCEERRDHVPIITTSDVNPFPFQLITPSRSLIL
ncbi:hypothetical protein BJ684DRAFT_15938 [Piptocephalis cylindrospora]|uniref:Autophagy-related protein 101 n=1 Tax=Piptocephalis cylindrospora TaxID=1907219 RepID=A0A4P9Y431_9FUNG|nr:hypothetical protein BJ684DRAFT_15938 [Piptocephalis cylindrospora]|eukprot:RKP13687.1 hypothetical protein BJ684DRAFT_15938 [Piptocephalis cylindrospora]